MVRKNTKAKPNINKKEINNNLGIASLILGIFSILTSMIIPLIAFLIGILGIVFSVKQKNKSPNGIAAAGLVTSIIGIILGIISWIINIFLLLNPSV
ncbi:MAG: hypothetical protein AABW65_01075 [Nanoarchaeota archaeon]